MNDHVHVSRESTGGKKYMGNSFYWSDRIGKALWISSLMYHDPNIYKLLDKIVKCYMVLKIYPILQGP